MGKEIVNQVQEAQRVPIGINPRSNTQRHTVIKLAKIKGRSNIKSNKGKTTNSIQSELPSGYQLISQQKFHKPGWTSTIYSK